MFTFREKRSRFANDSVKGSEKRWKGIILSLVVGPIVIARTCPDEQALPMDAAGARQEKI